MRFCSLLIILLVLSCQSSKNDLPVLSYKINPEGNKDYYTISYLGFTDQNGMQVSTETIENKILIANFFFTSCPSICPPMRNELIKISNEFFNEKDVLLISHSIDPKNDTIEVLKNYSEATEVPSSKWLFVKSSEANTKKQAQQFMTNFKPNKYGTDFYHSSYVALVDKNQMIRGFYNSLVSEDIVRLKADIRMLLE
jgi:protein SCO1/2